VRAEKIEEADDGIRVIARDAFTGQRHAFLSKVLINAAGPWIDTVRRAGELDHAKIIHPTKGIHLVTRRLSDQALFAASRDGRMFFIIPFGACSLIGTTDTSYDGDLDEVHADQNDIEYLLTESRRVLPGLPLSRDAVLYTYAGIRPLAFAGADESAISRKHRVVREGRTRRVITIAGGKLTTYRNMAKDAVDEACKAIGIKARCVTDVRPLAGNLSMDYEGYVREAAPELAARHKVSPELVLHLTGLYGSRASRVLELMETDALLGETISPESRDIYAQVAYSVRQEGARTLSDIILRRMHVGTTPSRGLGQIERIAQLAGRELRWGEDEKRHQVEEFKRELRKEKE
jgi:glycerol-3-phosphate dehydrogenase